MLSVAIPIIVANHASAGLITTRYIRMSSSAASAADVTYQVNLVTATTSTVGSMAIDFCSNNPIIGDTCNAPAGFNINEAGLAINNIAGPTDWNVNAATTTNTLILTRTTPANINSGVTITFELGDAGGSDGVTNPSATNTTFYARILTYVDADDDSNGCDNTDDSAVCYADTTPRIYIDAGGVALSTAAQITVTSRVQERLTFCVYTDVNCAAGGTAVALGDTNGVLDTAGPYVDVSTKYDVSTNASQGVAIRVKGPTLTTGGFTIDGMAAEAASSAASEQFGMCTYMSGGAAGLTPDTDYDGINGGNDCSDTTQTAGTGLTGGDGGSFFFFDPTLTNTTYGDVFANKTAGDTSNGVIAFIGNIANTTEAGVYTTTLTFIATGTY